MKLAPRRLISAALAVVSLCASAALPSAGVERGPQRRASVAPMADEARVIVKLKADSSLMRALSANATLVHPQRAQALGARLGLTLTDGRALGARTQVVKGQGLTSHELAARLAAHADVEYVSVDERKQALAAPNDPLYPAGQSGSGVPAVGQWYLRAPNSATIANSSSVVGSINAEAAWNIATGSGVVVAVLDTGVRFDHPDLAAKLLPGFDFIHDAPTSNDGDGRDTDASDAGDFGCGQADSSWHGTQTSGLIGAATNNGVGMAGVGRNAMVLPARVLGCGGGWDSDIQAAMLWAVGIAVPGVPTNTTPAKVVNMSLGAAGACAQSYVDAIAQVDAAGAVVVVAAGNEGLAVGTPANCPGAIAVGGVRHAGSKVNYSDLGPEIAIAAPAGNCVNASGVCLYPLLTTTNKGTTTPILGAAGASYTGSGADATLGTSFSAPLVAGTAALMYSANPALRPAQVRAALRSSARPFPASGFDPSIAACTAPTATAQYNECYCTTGTCGAGLLDASAATLAASTIHAAISAVATSVVAGGTVQLDGSGSWPSGGAALSQYVWGLTGPGTLTNSTTATPTLTATGAGSVTITLTVLDTATRQATASATVIAVAAPPSSGGGGGAMELGWLLGWLASVVGVWIVMRRRNRDD